MQFVNPHKVSGVGRCPQWLVNAVKYFVDLYDLGAYTVHVHHTTRATANKFLRKQGYESIDTNTPAMCIIDDDYLMAHIFFVRGMVAFDLNGIGFAAHECTHIWLRSVILERFRREVAQIDAGNTRYAESVTPIEEQAVERQMSILHKLGVLDSLLQNLKTKKS